MKLKKIVISVVSVVVALCAIFGIYCFIKNQNENAIPKETVIISGDTLINVNPKLNAEKTFNNLKISDIKLIEKGDFTTITASVQNISEYDMNDYVKCEIIMLGANGETVGTIPGIIPPVKAKSTTKLNSRITEDYVRAYDFRIEFDNT